MGRRGGNAVQVVVAVVFVTGNSEKGRQGGVGLRDRQQTTGYARGHINVNAYAKLAVFWGDGVQTTGSTGIRGVFELAN